jgi:hypothetical protein
MRGELGPVPAPIYSASNLLHVLLNMHLANIYMLLEVTVYYTAIYNVDPA